MLLVPPRHGKPGDEARPRLRLRAGEDESSARGSPHPGDRRHYHQSPLTIIADPVGAGLVDSLARPGGNSTGFMSYEHGFGAKWLELLKERSR
jgi:hypothetical protein